MQPWKGWIATSTTAARLAPTWDEWCARQQRSLRDDERQQPSHIATVPFNKRELARLSFIRWLYLRGCLEPAQTNNV